VKKPEKGASFRVHFFINFFLRTLFSRFRGCFFSVISEKKSTIDFSLFSRFEKLAYSPKTAKKKTL
jgi:hypothetical protein